MIEKIEEFLRFKESTVKLIKAHHSRFFSLSNSEFTIKYPTLYKEVTKWYIFLLRRKPNLNTCSAFIDAFMEIYNLKINEIMHNLNLKHTLKGTQDNEKVFEVGGNYYTFKSPNLTNEICEKIYAKYGANAFDSYDLNWREKEKIEFKGHDSIKVDSTNVKDFFSTIIEPKKAVKEEPKKETIKEVVAEIKEVVKKEVVKNPFNKGKKNRK